MKNSIRDRRLFKSSKNSTTLIQKSYPINNKNEIKNRKFSSEKFKTQVINQIYNKIFLSINNTSNTNNISINSKSKNKGNYFNYINPNKINIKKNIIRNQNNKSLNQKNNIPFPLKKTSKKKLKIKTKLYVNSFMQNDISKNYLKQTNSTTEVNISLNNENNIIEEKYDKIKKEKNNNNNSNENLILINISNIKNTSSNINSNLNNRKLSNNNILCPICLDSVSFAVRPNKCIHIFCFDCLSKW